MSEEVSIYGDEPTYIVEPPQPETKRLEEYHRFKSILERMQRIAFHAKHSPQDTRTGNALRVLRGDVKWLKKKINGKTDKAGGAECHRGGPAV